MNIKRSSVVLLAWLVCHCISSFATAQTFNERMTDWPMNLTVRGVVMAHGGGELPDDTVEDFQRYVKRSEVQNGKIVVLNLDVEKNKEDFNLEDDDVYIQIDRKCDDASKFGEHDAGSLNNLLTQASGVWIESSQSTSSDQRRLLLEISDALRNVVLQRGVLFAAAPIVSAIGKTEILSGQPLGDSAHAMIQDGAHIVPDAVLVANYVGDDDRLRLKGILASHPRSVGIAIQANTLLILSGRKMWVDGTGSATIMVAGNERKPDRIKKIAKRESDRANPMDWMVDLTGWRRDAIDRTLEPFPSASPEVPNCGEGTLIIVGGGGMPDGLMKKFVTIAGGKEAHLVYVPCSESEELSSREGRVLKIWEDLGVGSATMIHTKDRNAANSDPKILDPLRKATGVWFGGGRQWNFADSYYGTEAHRLMKEVLTKRNGVIGGSSAGASIQGRYLARATPVANFKIMAAGYERGGLGFLSGVAIDQHFSQRGRQPDLTELVDTYPQLLGIGIDEATAIIVRQSEAKVVGNGRVFFYDRTEPVLPGEDDFIALPAESRFDLEKRIILKDTRDE